MKRLIAATALAVIVTAGCSSSVDNPPDVGPTDPTTGNLNPSGGTPPPAPAATAVLFQPAQGIFPFPNDLYFSGTTDGTINIQPANGLIPNQVGLNALDGWSTTAPIRVRFASAVNPASFSAANVRVYQVTVSNTNKAVAGFTRPLTYGTEFSVGCRHRRRRRQHDSRDPTAGATGAVGRSRRADGSRARRHGLSGAAAERHPDGERRSGHGRPRLRDHQDDTRA